MDRTLAILVPQKWPRQAPRDQGGGVPQGHELARTGGALHFEVVAKIVMELLQRLNQQEIDREPDRPAPVGVAAKQSSGRFAGLIIDSIFGVAEPQHVRIIAMVA